MKVTHKLNYDLAQTIRQQYSDGASIRDLSKQYSVSYASIWSIITKTTYAERRFKRTPEEARLRHLRQHKDWHHMNKYGMTYDEVVAMKDACGNKCQICGAPPEESHQGNLVVDHCHDTGVVRGILCGRCNIVLGKVKDSPELLHKLVDYLKQHGKLF